MSVLRKDIPWTTVREVFQLLGLSTETPFEFQRSQIILENSLQAANLIEPYYLPCKSKIYFNNLDAQKWTTLLRQIVQSHGYQLKSLETTRNRKKVVLYTLIRLNDTYKASDIPIHVDFS